MKKAFSFLLSLLVVCAALPMTPVTAQAFDSYAQAYDAEYYAPASASFIYQIGLYFSSSSDEDAISHIESAGYTPFGGDFNAGAGGKFVHAGYKTTSDPTKALTTLRIWDFTAGGDNPDTPRDSATGTVNGSACTFCRVGSGASEWTPNVLDGDVNLNQGNSGHHLKLYVTTDRSAGLPLAALDTAHDKTAATAYNTLLNAGYTVATSFQAPLSYQDLNAGAGSKSDYNYLGFKAYAFTAVDSSGLRSAYAAAKERYENGGSAYSALSSPLTAGAAILADLNDGFTSRTQAEVDAAASALGNALYFTVTVSGGSCSGSVFKEGDSVTITANTPAAGKRFKEWTGADGLTFTSGSKTEATATFTMPAANVNLTATFEDITVYKVTLSPGEATGEEIVFSSAAQTEIPTINNAGYNMFYYENDGSMGFRFDPSICPEGWSDPRGRVFTGFVAGILNTLTQENTVFTAQWSFVGGINMTSDVTLDFDSIDADGFLPITLDVYNINFGNDHGEANLDVKFPSGALTDGNNQALPFDVYTADHSRTLERIHFKPDNIPCSCCLTLKFDPAALADAEYGEYHCTWSCALQWNDTDGMLPETTEISLHMTRQDQNVYSVTVTSEGSGTAYASTDSGTAGTQVALTATPAEGWYFREWQVISGGVTLHGDRFNISHADVKLKAVFEEIATHTHSVTVTSTEGGTAHASLASGVYGTLVTLTAVPEHGYALKQWQVVSGGVTVTHNTFTIGDDDVEIRAVFAQEPTYTLELPQSVTVTPGTVFTPVTVTVPELTMVTGVNGKTPLWLRIVFNAGTLTDPLDAGKTIEFYPDNSMSYPTIQLIQLLCDFQSAGSQTDYVHILDRSWSTAAPGVYTGEMSYRVFWIYTDKSTSKTLESGSIPVTVTIPAPGDVDSDGEVDLADVTLLSRYLAGGWNVTIDETVADVNKDGIVDLKDVVLIRRYLAGGWDIELK